MIDPHGQRRQARNLLHANVGCAVDAAQLDRYERLLELSDPDLYNWMSAREPVPPEHDNDVMRLLIAFNFKTTVA